MLLLKNRMNCIRDRIAGKNKCDLTNTVRLSKNGYNSRNTYFMS